MFNATPSSFPVYGGASEYLTAGAEEEEEVNTLGWVAVLLTAVVYALLTYPSPLIKMVKSSDSYMIPYSGLLAILAGAAPSYFNGATEGPIAQGVLGALMTGMMAAGAVSAYADNGMEVNGQGDAQMMSIAAGIYGAIYAWTIKFSGEGEDESAVKTRSIMTSWFAVLVLIVVSLLVAMVASA